MSKGYYNDDCDHCKKEKKPCPTIIKCSCPGSATLSTLTPAGIPSPLTSLTLNTSCLCNPCTKLEFASNLIAPVAFTGTINFQVSKLCRGQSTPIPVGPAWTFSGIAVTAAETFSFFVCDCDSCFDDCCTYTVAATAATITLGTLSINNATLGAISTCGQNQCC
jgi:hypothetical protein